MDGCEGNKSEKHEKSYERVVTFDQETVGKLNEISLMASDVIFKEIEKLGLGAEGKIIAHYYVAKHYYDSIEKVMMEIGIRGMTTKVKKDG